jgi:hypothetical protein
MSNQDVADGRSLERESVQIIVAAVILNEPYPIYRAGTIAELFHELPREPIHNPAFLPVERIGVLFRSMANRLNDVSV